MRKDVEKVKDDVAQLKVNYDKLFAMCLRQIKPAMNLTKQEIAQRVIERNQLIKALESYLADKGEKDA